MRKSVLILCTALLAPGVLSAAETQAPWGQAKVMKQTYANQKVVYDVAVNSEAALRSVISRVGLLANLNGNDPFDTKIVVVLHGNEIPYFAIGNYAQYSDLMQRAQGVSQNGIVEFRMCRIAAKGHGFEPADIHGFVTMVPMADTEIVRLQQTGYAYMR